MYDMEMKPVQTHLENIKAALANSQIAIPLDLKLRLAELILRTREARPNRWFGLFVILGWKADWNEYTDISDSAQDIFSGHPNIKDLPMQRSNAAARDIASTLDFDGAILVDADGSILHSGVMIEGLRPRMVANTVNPGQFADLSEQFGFTGKVHTRHLSAITASYIFQPSMIITMSEETGDFHLYEQGKIVYTAAYDQTLNPVPGA